jgi:hypothetical protein
MSPFIVTIDMESMSVLAIRRNWSPSDEDNRKRLDWITHYTFVPGPGFYALGFAHLLGNLQMTLTTTMRSLVDAGQFANLQGGFKAKGLRIGNDDPIGPGEWREIESYAQDLKDALYPIPYKEPSQTLFNLLEYMNGIGQKFADSTEQVVADSTNYGPVGTTMALLEASKKFHAAIHKRLFFAQEHELKVISRINYEFLPNENNFDIIGASKLIFREDFDPDVIDVIPVSDPNLSSQAQRISLAETQLHLATQHPQIHNMKEAYKNMYRAIGVEDIDRILPPDDEPVPSDPLTDILNAAKGKPIAAFPGQDHDAHMMVKGSWLQDPENGASIPMQTVAPLIMANIQEHQIMKYQEQLYSLDQRASMDEQILAQNAQKLAHLNEIARQEEEQGSPAFILAQAEMKDANTREKAEERETAQAKLKGGLDILKTMADIEVQSDKLSLDTTRMANELIKTGQEHVRDLVTEEEKAKNNDQGTSGT